jgi:hypothetical protein
MSDLVNVCHKELNIIFPQTHLETEIFFKYVMWVKTDFFGLYVHVAVNVIHTYQ